MKFCYARRKLYKGPEILITVPPQAGAVSLADMTYGTIEDCIFSNHSGTHGTVYAAHESILKIDTSIFTENLVAFGGGIFLDGKVIVILGSLHLYK